MKILESKSFTSVSLILNLIFIFLLILLVGALFYLGILPPFSSTQNSISDIPVFNEENVLVESYVSNLEIPWDFEFVDENSMLVTERPGRVRLVKDGDLTQEPALDLTNQVVAIGEAGLMGIAKHPNFENNKLIYLYHTYDNNGTTKLKISRYTFENDKLVNEELIFGEIPAGNVHSGGQMEFGPDGKLYVTTGDVANDILAQDMNSLAGKTLRFSDDGSVPADNPYFDSENSNKSLIFSLGHRNAQGLDWHPQTWEMYQSEHGPSGFDGGTGMDEINFVKRGGNYGWPNIRGEETSTGMYSPLLVYTPAVAPASATFYDGDMFPELQNMLLVGTLRGNSILVISVNGDNAKEEYRLIESDYGRIRYVGVGPDGAIYFTTSNRDGRGDPSSQDDQIYKISKK